MTPPSYPSSQADPAFAVVVGLCAHGLALVRSLAAAGIPVIALEANPRLPGVRTRQASVRLVDDINGPGLLDALCSLRTELPETPLPVLFLTNDNMVRTVGSGIHRLSGLYRLSWEQCRESVLKLLDKASLEAHCARLGLPYPRSWLLEHAAQHGDELPHGLPYPLIVKPTRPLSGFKVRKVDDQAALVELIQQYPHAAPFLLQQWIPGDDRQLLFVAMYLDQGRVLSHFTGRKLASLPPAMGQTTIAEAYPPHEAAWRTAQRFFEPLQLSGPVSLEMKLDDSGTPWIIEPTIGRTDYWLDCCNANGVPFCVVEYMQQTSQALEERKQTRGMIWFDTERSPLAYVRFRLAPPDDVPRGWRPRFAYLRRGDMGPFYVGLRRTAGSFVRRAYRKLLRMR